MVNAQFPGCKQDNRPWQPTDHARSKNANTPLAYRGILLQVKANWAEFTTSMAFTSWSSDVSPCPFCDTRKATTNKHARWWPLTPMSTLNTHAAYDAACRRCEIRVTLNQRQWTEVGKCLQYSRSKTGPRGRGLTRDIPALGLLRHDRLEPDNIVLQDVAEYDNITAWPITVTFWRRSQELLGMIRK